MDRPPFRIHERVRATVSHYGVQAGDEGEISRVFADGSVEVEVTERPSALMRARYGSLASRPPFVKRQAARFSPDEVRRPGER